VKTELSFLPMVCNEYDRLLNLSEKALERWNARQEEMICARSTGLDTGREILRLQAGFSKAYLLLRKHVEECACCRFVSEFEIRRSSGQDGCLPVVDGVTG
jgi:hypothetical protein